jgi:hypothetical protein
VVRLADQLGKYTEQGIRVNRFHLKADLRIGFFDLPESLNSLLC